MKTVSIVCLTYNNRQQVRRCLPTVAALAERPEVCEWLILDNGSTDGTRDDVVSIAANSPKARAIYAGTNHGCGGGRSILWRQAGGGLVLSLDSDVTVTDPDCLPRMIADLERPGVGIVGEHGGRVRPDWSWTEEAARDHVGPVQIVCGFAQLFRREHLAAWQPRMEYGPYWLDDSEWCLQIVAAYGLTGWVGQYGLEHEWSHTNGRDERQRRAAWAAFRERWRDLSPGAATGC
jgi:glycosyltransferase involved in cell wall biosynthesis